MPLSFEEACLPFRQDLLVYATRLTRGDAQRAADIVQESLIRAFRAWSRWEPKEGYDELSCVRAWLYRIVTHKFSTDYMRLKSRLATREAYAIEVALEEEHPETVEDGFGDEVQAALAQLTPEHQDIILRHFIRGQSCEQIAFETRTSYGTVRTRLHRAKKSLAPLLKDFARTQYSLHGTGEDAAGLEPAEVLEPKANRVNSVVRDDDAAALEFVEPAPDARAAG